jgi:hypothetical protein
MRRSLIVALLAPVAMVALGIPDWIPGWNVAPLVVVLALVGIGAIVARAVSGARAGRSPLALAFSSLALGAWVLAAGVIAVFLVKGGMFPPTYIRTIDAPGGRTFYLYGNSFLDPAVLVTARVGWLPIQEELIDVPGCRPEAVRELGRSLEVSEHRCDLERGECAE